jgi:hypothetical protein
VKCQALENSSILGETSTRFAPTSVRPMLDSLLANVTPKPRDDRGRWWTPAELVLLPTEILRRLMDRTGRRRQGLLNHGERGGLEARLLAYALANSAGRIDGWQRAGRSPAWHVVLHVVLRQKICPDLDAWSAD